VDSGVLFAPIIVQILMHGLSAKNWVIQMLELDLHQYHLELARQTNQFGFHTFTVKERRQQLRIVFITSHGIMESLPATIIPMICQYLVLMVSTCLLTQHTHTHIHAYATHIHIYIIYLFHKKLLMRKRSHIYIYPSTY